MSVAAIAWVFKQSVPKSSVKFVLVALADNAGDTGECWPSIETLSSKTSQDRKTVISALDKLTELGFIADTGKRAGYTKSVKVYRLLMEAVPKTEQAQKRSSSVFPMKQSRFSVEAVPKTEHRTVIEPSGNLTAIGTGSFPTLEQVKTKAQFIGVPEKEAEMFWNHFEASGWIDKNGNAIVRWESKLATWKVNNQQLHSPGKTRPPSILDLRTVLEAKEYTANELKKHYCSEAALGETWNDQAKFGQWKLLRKEIRNLRETISKSA